MLTTHSHLRSSPLSLPLSHPTTPHRSRSAPDDGASHLFRGADRSTAGAAVDSEGVDEGDHPRKPGGCEHVECRVSRRAARVHFSLAALPGPRPRRLPPRHCAPPLSPTHALIHSRAPPPLNEQLLQEEACIARRGGEERKGWELTLPPLPLPLPRYKFVALELLLF